MSKNAPKLSRTRAADRRCTEIETDISRLLDDIQILMGRSTKKEQRDSGYSLKLLTLRQQIGSLVVEYKQIFNKAKRKGAVEQLSKAVGRSDSDLAHHAQFAEMPEILISAWAEQRLNWEQVIRKMKGARATLDELDPFGI